MTVALQPSMLTPQQLTQSVVAWQSAADSASLRLEELLQTPAPRLTGETLEGYVMRTRKQQDDLLAALRFSQTLANAYKEQLKVIEA